MLNHLQKTLLELNWGGGEGPPLLDKGKGGLLRYCAANLIPLLRPETSQQV